MHSILFSGIAANIQHALSNIQSHVNSYILEEGPVILVQIVAAAVIFVVGKWAAGLAQRLFLQALRKAKVEQTIARFLSRIVYVLVIYAIAVAALEKLGVNTTSLSAMIAAAGLAVGLALQGSLSNFAAGVIIIVCRPFKVGDFIEAAGTKGVVEEIHIFNTLMHTPDNVDIIVPNNAITSSNITNYSSKPQRRIDLVVGCGYKDDLLAVKKFLEELVLSDGRVLRDPAPVVAVHELGDNSVNFIVRPWVRNNEYWQVRWDLIEKIKLGFDQHGFSIPFPQQDIHVHTASTSSSFTATSQSKPSGASRLFADSPAPAATTASQAAAPSSAAGQPAAAQPTATQTPTQSKKDRLVRPRRAA